MPLKLTFALSQQQTFELRFNNVSRPLDKAELAALIDLCEQNYYTQQTIALTDLTQLGHQLYQWLDGNEGWLRRSLNEVDQTIYLDLIQTSEAQGLNPETERVALGLAHLPWELLHDGAEFLVERRDISVLPVRSVQQRQAQVIGVQNRPLRLLFMATSPEDPRVPPLSFEQQEANILQATKEQPLVLIVESSGSVAELANLVQSYPENYFDVFHLTGHGIIYTRKDYGYLLPQGATLPDNTPCLITEDDVGDLQLTTVNDLARGFRGRWPRVIFLSGSHLGQVPNKGTVPSIAQALVKAGAGIVLGWALPVYERTGIVAAQALYRALAAGASVEAAIKAAQQEMIDKKCTDWHLLRMYRDTRPIAELVTPLRTKNRQRRKFTAPEPEFLDENNQIKVASQFEFVGRRRDLQRCLKALQETSEQIGVFIAGMDGVGKSSLAAQLCTRVQAQRPNFARVVLIGPLDEWGLLTKLSNKYQEFADVPALLNQPKVTLKGRLQNFFKAIENVHNQPLLLVLDGFEQNIPNSNIEDGSLRMTAEAYEILEAICAALAETGAESRLIVTCRYLKSDTLPPHRLHLESLARMSSSDIDQICFPLNKKVKQQLRTQRIINIANGNPRLLKWLLEVIGQLGLAGAQLLNRLEKTEPKFRENILAQTLLGSLEPEEQKFLAQMSVFDLPVTEEIISVFMQNLSPTLPEQTDVSLASIPILHKYLANRIRRYTNQVRSVPCAVTIREVLVPGLGCANIGSRRSDFSVRELNLAGLLLRSSHRRSVSLRKRLGRLCFRSPTRILVSSHSVCLTEGILHIWDAPISLSLVEFATTDPIQPANYRVATILKPMLESVLSQSEWQATRQQAVRKIYQVWWEDSNQPREVEGLEIVRLGLLAREQEIAVSVGDWIATRWVNSSRFVEAFELCKQILAVFQDYRILGSIARAEEALGFVQEAVVHFQQALDLCPQEDLQEKAATLHEMAGLKVQQGDVLGAIAFYKQCLQIEEDINDVLGKAETLHEMAGLKAEQGDISGAIAFYEESLQIEEDINDDLEKAATLANQSYWAGETGDQARQLDYNLQAAVTLAQIRAYINLVKVLSNLGVADESNGLVYLAQAIWLTLRIQASLADTIELINVLYNKVPLGDELEALLGATAIFFCNYRGEGDPQLEKLQERSFEIISGAADAQGIETEEGFNTWFTQQRLNDPEYFLPRLNQRLEEIVGDGWLFDPSQV
ncbi:CHAT domain-containing protein [Nostoc sp. JL33]|uniref:CHAT domain-containing protein n=1 Tax=Nostoc sp. JL33 TaxID=2815396 RepID=UPI0025D67628|nr:CHAT domain-containing protein [Nostoc sp. JL33]MBN3872051.1 CHAT domain-containing protein [Nostoc sp. JL33]